MSLTNDEQDALALIERGLRRGDPLLADRFAVAPTVDQRRCRALWARRMMGVGGLVTLLGLIAADGVISLGAILCAYGLLIFFVAVAVAGHNRTQDKGRQGWRWRSS